MSNWDYATDEEYEQGMDAYPPGDPKRPDFYDMACEKADLERKQRKEDALFACSPEDIDESGGVA